MTGLTSPLNLTLLVLLCCLVTLLPRLTPLYVFRDRTPRWLEAWLDYMPAAVMAALVFPDLLFREGVLDLNPLSNLFIPAGLATIVFCWFCRNFVATILFGMAFVAAARLLDLWA